MSEFSQHSLNWFRSRLGMITGSRVGVLTGRKRNTDEFNDTALAYIYEVSATRYMNPTIVSDDDLFAAYIEQTNVETRAMAWGTEQEESARHLYAKTRKVEVTERGSVEHPTIDFFASSPDGFIPKDNEGKSGCVEIKCPSQAVFEKYRAEVKDNATLKTVKKEYYYQCQSHIMCTGADYCDFIVYCPYQMKPLYVVRILPDEDAFNEIETNVNKANEIIKKLHDQ